jgi:hypothetical protein
MDDLDFAVLQDITTDLICHFVPVNNATEHLVSPVRDMFIESMNNFGYVGFSREIDDIFHRNSTYIYISEAGNVVMTARVTTRPLGAIIPFEMGIRESGGSYNLHCKEHIVDINTFTYVRGYCESALPLMTAGLGCFTKACGAQRAYCLYDIANEKIKRIYNSIGFVQSEAFPEAVYFPTFYRARNGRLEPARWRVMEWSHETIERQAASGRRYRSFLSICGR